MAHCTLFSGYCNFYPANFQCNGSNNHQPYSNTEHRCGKDSVYNDRDQSEIRRAQRECVIVVNNRITYKDVGIKLYDNI